MKRLLILLLGLGLCGCAAPAPPVETAEPPLPSPLRGETPSPSPVTRSTPNPLESKLQPEVDRLLARLEGGISQRWGEAPGRVQLTLSRGERQVVARWTVEGGTVRASNDLARKLELGRAWTREELSGAVPLEWLPVLEVTAVGRPRFQPVARVAPPAEPPPKKAARPSPPAVVLLGVMTGDVTKAFLQIGGKHHALTVGEKAGGYRVTSISRGKVVLSGYGRVVEKELDLSAAFFNTPPQDEQPVPQQQESEPEVKVLSNDDLDYEPPEELEGGWRVFRTGEE